MHKNLQLCARVVEDDMDKTEASSDESCMSLKPMTNER